MKFNRKKLLSNLKDKRVMAIIAILVIAILVSVYFLFLKDNVISEPETPITYHSKLTGKAISEDESNLPILGIMIENSEVARPQTGLDSAGIVFEAVTEGGITRFLALYQEDKPELVGPIRSLRLHFLNWAMGFDASIAHVGGSAEALELADARDDARSMNQFTYPEPYSRDETQEAPHNVYSKTKNLASLQEQLEHAKADFDDFPRIDEAPAEMPEANKITIDYSSPAFLVQFRYNKESNSYTRLLAGEPHIDTITGEPITVKNVVVIKTKGLSAGVDNIGQGEALVFYNGSVIKAKWILDDFTNRLKLVDEQNQEIPLIKGDAWIAAPANDRKVTF